MKTCYLIVSYNNKKDEHIYKYHNNIKNFFHGYIHSFFNNKFVSVLYILKYRNDIDLKLYNFEVIEKYDLNNEQDVYNLLSECKKSEHIFSFITTKILNNTYIRQHQKIIDLFIDFDYMDRYKFVHVDSVDKIMSKHYIKEYIEYLSIYAHLFVFANSDHNYYILKYLFNNNELSDIKTIMKFLENHMHSVVLHILYFKDEDLLSHIFENYTDIKYDLSFIYNMLNLKKYIIYFKPLMKVFNTKYKNLNNINVIFKIYGDNISIEELKNYFNTLLKCGYTNKKYYTFQEFIEDYFGIELEYFRAF